MGNQQSAPPPIVTTAPSTEINVLLGKSGKKICCSCPDTKQIRDLCLVEHGQDSGKCDALIEAHKQCLRSEGFTVK